VKEKGEEGRRERGRERERERKKEERGERERERESSTKELKHKWLLTFCTSENGRRAGLTFPCVMLSFIGEAGGMAGDADDFDEDDVEAGGLAGDAGDFDEDDVEASGLVGDADDVAVDGGCRADDIDAGSLFPVKRFYYRKYYTK